MYDSEIYRQVAQLHASNIDQGFLSSLGTPFLSLLYEAIDVNESSVLLIAQHEGRVVGFVTGAEGMGSIYRQLLTRWPRLVVALLPAIASPRKLLKIAEILLMGKKAMPIPDLPHAELLSIAVSPTQRGQGHSQTLYRALVDHFRKRGVCGFRIVVGEQLETAHRFYKRMGATPVGQIEVHHGQASTIYVHRLSCAELITTAPI
jgi:ribosomal protein S18 acetylase RimI-like enzyme